MLSSIIGVLSLTGRSVSVVMSDDWLSIIRVNRPSGPRGF